MSLFVKTEILTDKNGVKREVRKVRKLSIFIACVAVIALIVLATSCYVVIPTGHTGVITTFGKVENRVLSAGFNWKSPFQKVIKMDTRNQKKSMTTQAFSSDIQQVDITMSLNFSIDRETAKTMYSTVGLEYYDTVIMPKILEGTKTICSQYTAEALISSRQALSEKIYEIVQSTLKTYNIQIIAVNIENIDFTDAFTEAVEAKQVAAQKKLTAETEQATLTMQAEQEANRKIITAKADAEAVIIAAEAEAKANEKVAKSLTPEILTKMFYDKWDGVVSKVSGSNSGLILPSEIME